MFLKRLDVIGFKSFAERISVDFVKGVTAVVGPTEAEKATSRMPFAGFSANNRHALFAAEKWKTSFLPGVIQESD